MTPYFVLRDGQMPDPCDSTFDQMGGYITFLSHLEASS